MSEGTKKLKLHVIGVLHDSKEDGGKILEIGKKVVPNAIFIESPVRKLKDVRFRGLLRCFLQNPVIFLLYSLMVCALSISCKLGHREVSHVDWVYSKKTCQILGIPPPFRVDDDIYLLITNRRFSWSIVSWLIFCISIYSLIFQHLLLALCAILYPLFFIEFIRTGAPLRNEHMLNRLFDIVYKNNYKNVLLVTGKKHIPDFKERIKLYRTVDAVFY